MDAYGVRRKDTTKGPPLRVLSLGTIFFHLAFRTKVAHANTYILTLSLL